MGMPKRTYSLPADTLARFERAVQHGKRASVIADLIRSWLDEQRRARTRLEIADGCREMAEIYLETEREFHPLEEEVQHALDTRTAKGRGRARAPGPRRRIRTGR